MKQNIKLFEEWLAEAESRAHIPESWENACKGCEVKWIDDFTEAKNIMFKHEDDKKMDKGTFSKIFGRQYNKKEEKWEETTQYSEFKGGRFLYIIVDDHVASAIYCGYREDNAFGMNKPTTPFIYEMGSMKDEKGRPIYNRAGGRAIAEFLKEYGLRFWLVCASDEAQSFWKHVGKKTGSYVKYLKRSSWGQPVFEFNPDIAPKKKD